MPQKQLELPFQFSSIVDPSREQREEILRAFIAKYGLQPDEVVQVYKITPEGWVYSVRKRTK